METKEKILEINSQDISGLLKKYYFSLMSSFYETQSSYLTRIYKKYNSIESGNIVLCFERDMHLSIIRQREKDLNHNVSYKKLLENINNIEKPFEKISTIVKITKIPKETARRKMKKLLSSGYLIKNENVRAFSWNFDIKHRNLYFEDIEEEIKNLSKYIYKFAKFLKLDLDLKSIEDEIKSQFSFYWYHFLTCQLEWLKIWQSKLKDNDLLLIVLQTVIPILQFADKHSSDVNVENMFKIIGAIGKKYNVSQTAISAATVSEVTGIPRATCIRKLEKLVFLGFLIREIKTKRYFVNQNVNDRTINVFSNESVNYTIEAFSNFLAIILNSLIINRI